jgi:hypothetical protein
MKYLVYSKCKYVDVTFNFFSDFQTFINIGQYPEFGLARTFNNDGHES